MSQEWRFSTTLLIGVALTCAAVAAMLGIYRQKSARPLPPEKPTLAFFPKYYVKLPSTQAQREDLAGFMEQQGFRNVDHESGKKQFERGSVFGDLSLKWAKVKVSESDDYPGCLLIEYGTVCLFDTGDLWKFSKEIEELMANPN